MLKKDSLKSRKAAVNPGRRTEPSRADLEDFLGVPKRKKRASVETRLRVPDYLTDPLKGFVPF
jgi:hypothetical protein